MADHTPHHRHQASLESVIAFSIEPPLSVGERAQAKRRFLYIVNHFEGASRAAAELAPAKGTTNRLLSVSPTSMPSEKSRDLYLRAFFRSAALSVTGDNVDFSDKHLEEEVCSSLLSFADYLIDNFFLPLKASTRKTPQPSSAHSSAFEYVQGGERQSVRTPELRGNKYGLEPEDDHRMKLTEETNWGKLEVAHILPHSLIRFTKDDKMSGFRASALTVLNMLDCDAVRLIEGSITDQPRNALTFESEVRDHFNNFSIYFTPVEGAREANTYRIDSFLPLFLARGRYPVTRTLIEAQGNVIDAPVPRFLAIHRAIAHVLHLSVAGEYIDRILQDIGGIEA
ncbi:hypothetical protein F5Y12DRAFT_799984 [Xylaria sp. FL1777]|nr:hypothetical protein F5Y12DRAFT_799984 [Xylaria sp. FL1777]